MPPSVFVETPSCRACKKVLPINLRDIKCAGCSSYFHIKCCNLKSKAEFLAINLTINKWKCHYCVKPCKKVLEKCTKCKKSITKPLLKVSCTLCKKNFHKKCSTRSDDIWTCDSCLDHTLPFFNLDSQELILELQGKSINFPDIFSLPSFRVKTLLDKLPGSITIQTQDFLSNSIQSKYFTPADFISSKIPKNCFSIFHLNIASLEYHVDELKSLISVLNHDFDVIGITETKIKNSEPLSNLKLEGYNFEFTPTNTSFGGTSLYVRDCYAYEKKSEYTISLSGIAESTFIEIKSDSSKNVIIGCIYRHHCKLDRFMKNFFEKLIINICDKEKSKYCILMGDFNADLLKTDSDLDIENFFNFLSSFGFRPLILQPTRVTSSSATLIDNIFINSLETESFGGNITTSISDHFSQFCMIDILKKAKHVSVPLKQRTFRNFNDDEFINEIKKFNWNSLLLGKNLDDSFSTFYKSIEKLLDEMAPIKTLKSKEQKLQQRPWITGDILDEMHNRDNLHKLFKAEQNRQKKNEIWATYKKKRNKVLSLIKISKTEYFKSFFETNKLDIKKTWQGIKNIININKKVSTLPDKLIYKKKIFERDSDIATSFNHFFTNIGNTVEEKIPKTNIHFSTYMKNKPSNSIFLEKVTDTEVKDLINDLNTSKSCGPYSIPSCLLKKFSDYFCEPIKILLNKSLCEGKFPSLLKLADVCPIFKKSDKNKCENYRPISLLSNISKFFERIMHSRVYRFLEKYNLLYKNQFGFRKKHSTNHAILSIVEDIHENLACNNFVCGVFIDLEKAFDTVNHEILLQKLNFYGIRGTSNLWFKSYLENRKQRVKYKSTFSENLSVTCGVPQGSILGPLLFLIYINDMNQAIKNSTTFHFADDTYLKFSSSCENTIRKKMNEDLEKLFTWLCANRLSLNVAKTEFIVFKPPRKSLTRRLTLKLNNTKLFESKKLKYLGLIVDDRLSWKFHINELTKKLGRSIGVLYRLKKTGCPKKILLNVYFALVQSQLSYGLMAWGSASKYLIEKLSLLQKKAVRIISNSSYLAHTAPLLKELGILNIEDLYQHQYALFMFDYDRGSLPKTFNSYFCKVSDVHSHQTRSSSSKKLALPVLANTNKHVNSLIKCSGVNIFNKIVTLDFFKSSFNKSSFSKKFRNYLVSLY